MNNELDYIKKVKNKISMWGKWDLHIHTPVTNLMVPHDYKNPEKYNDGELINKLYANDITLGVITDHNIFDASKFDVLKGLVETRNKKENKNLVLLPGVELNVKFPNSQKDSIHFILIFDEKENLNNIQLAVENLNKKTGFTKGNPQDATIDDIADVFSAFNYIVSIHLGKSSNVPRKQNYDEFLKIYIGGFVNICENNPSNKVKNKEYLEKRVKDITGNNNESIFIVGSDNHDVTKYPLGENNTCIPKLTYFKAIPSFEGLKMIITEPTRIYNSDNDTLPNYVNTTNDLNKIEAISIKGDKIGTKELYFSRELNSIIGSRTSGKSLLLNIIKYALGKEYDIEKYDEYINKLEVKVKTFDDNEFKGNNSLQIEVFDQNRLMNEFNKIKSERDFFKETYISKKFDEISLDDNTINEIYNNEIGIECDFIKKINDLYKMIYDIKMPNVYLKNYINFGKNTTEMSKFYLKVLEIKKFEKTMKNLSEKQLYLSESIKTLNNIITNDKYGYINKNRLIILNEILDDFKRQLYIVDKKIIGIRSIQNLDISVYKPFSVNESFIIEHQNFIRDIKKIARVKKELDNISAKIDLFENRKFKIDGKERYEQSIEVREFKFCSSLEYKTNFYTDEAEPKHIVARHFYSEDIKNGWKHLIEKIFLKKTANKKLFKTGNVESITNEIKLEKPKIYKTIIDNKGVDINSTSPGNRASVLISIILENTENKVLIIDQPEDNLDSKFIYQEIVKKIKTLKESRQIFLVTHNANIVVNSDSENVICCKNDDNNIKYEYGAIEYNQNIFDSKNMKEYILDNLEGTEEAFRLRNNKYFLKGVLENEHNNNK